MAIELQDVSFTYLPGTPYERQALRGINLKIQEGSITALAGHTGSGKSTLLQHIGGLLQPDRGQVCIDGVDLAAHTKQEKRMALAACRKVGLVFQYAEHQLFEESIYEDIAFGPRNFGLAETDVEARVQEAMARVHLDYDAYRDRSPFQLSGGQMRRVALAGVLALHPAYLVLDEPTAGLDPRGRRELLQMIRELHAAEGTTIVFVSHNMEDVFAIADEVVVLRQGKILLQGAPADVFAQGEQIAAAGLRQPELMRLLSALRAAGVPLSAEETAVRTPAEAAQAIVRALKEKGGRTHAQ